MAERSDDFTWSSTNYLNSASISESIGANSSVAGSTSFPYSSTFSRDSLKSKEQVDNAAGPAPSANSSATILALPTLSTSSEPNDHVSGYRLAALVAALMLSAFLLMIDSTVLVTVRTRSTPRLHPR